jgi:hypothetical protein
VYFRPTLFQTRGSKLHKMSLLFVSGVYCWSDLDKINFSKGAKKENKHFLNGKGCQNSDILLIWKIYIINYFL